MQLSALPPGYETPDFSRGVPHFDDHGKIVAYSEDDHAAEWEPFLIGGRVVYIGIRAAASGRGARFRRLAHLGLEAAKDLLGKLLHL